MLKLNDIAVDLNKFPDGTMLMKADLYNKYCRCQRDAKNKGENVMVSITWFYENDTELIALIYLTRHLQTKGFTDIRLNMPYVPNARQDRVKKDEDVFTLKYFTEVINSLGFSAVTVLDVHSNVGLALINNVRERDPSYFITKAVSDIKDRNNDVEPFIFYPDAGAEKRYGNMLQMPCAYGVKTRDWETGQLADEIQVYGTDVTDLQGKPVLIVDDICSRGGTFVRAAKALKKLNAGKIYLYVTHCENTILDGVLLTDGYVEEVYTTNSVFKEKHERIHVMHL